MKKYFYDPPFIIKKIFNNFRWNTVNNRVLFTFDDGPNPSTTEKILKICNELKIKALFFCVGDNLSAYPSVVSELIAEGHTIGNHTCSHNLITGSGKDSVLNDLILFNNLLMNRFDYKVEYFRPPHGKFNFSTERILNEAGLKNVMWSLLTYDFRNDINIVKNAVKKYLRNNSIIVLHDSEKSSLIIEDSVKLIYEEAVSKSYQIGEPAGCLN
ncbi:MAG: polysaccharide deacetylase family protein [Ignavibacteriaceae bacterium]